MRSLAFDQAVPYYDRTRADPPWVMRAIANSIIRQAQLSNDSRILEIGVGTGRIALVLAERGLALVGVDLSLPMMGELQNKIAGQPDGAVPATAITLAQADANALPFEDESMDCVYAAHVFHLVGDWEHALNETLRVLKPAGTLLISYHERRPDSPNHRIRRKLAELVQPHGIDIRRPGAQSSEEIRAELTRLCGSATVVRVAEWREPGTVEQVLGDLSHRIFSETWAIPPDLMERVMPALREWSRAEFGDTHRAIEENSEFNWIAARK